MILITFSQTTMSCYSRLDDLNRHEIKGYQSGFLLSFGSFPVGTRYCGDIGFLLDLHRDIDRLRIETEVTLLYDIFFQHYNDVAAITKRSIKLHVIEIPIFNVLISDKDENVINNGKYVVLFHLSKYSNKLYGNIVYKIQIEMSNFIQVLASLVLPRFQNFDFRDFLGSSYIN